MGVAYKVKIIFPILQQLNYWILNFVPAKAWSYTGVFNTRSAAHDHLLNSKNMNLLIMIQYSTFILFPPIRFHLSWWRNKVLWVAFTIYTENWCPKYYPNLLNGMTNVNAKFDLINSRKILEESGSLPSFGHCNLGHAP